MRIRTLWGNGAGAEAARGLGPAALVCVVAGPLSSLAWQSRPQLSGSRAGAAGGGVRQPTTACRCRPSTGRCRRRSDCCSTTRSRTVCTAFCVAPATWWRRPATACSASPARRPPRIARFLVRAQLRRRARLSPASPATPTARQPQHVMSGAMTLNVRPPIDATKDWALVRLARPVCTKGVLPVRALPRRADHRGGRRQARVPDLLSSRLSRPGSSPTRGPAAWPRASTTADWSTIAQDFSDPDALLLHTCDTGGASSGSPLLLDTREGPGGDRHQRRHLRAIEGADAGRQGRCSG